MHEGMHEPTDDINDLPRARLPYERHRREVVEEQIAPASDPTKWHSVRIGLRLIFWAWVVIVAIAGLFIAFLLANVVLLKADVALVRNLGLAAAGIVVLAGLVSFAGQCFCIATPRGAHAKGLAIAAVVVTVIAAGLAGITIYQMIVDISQGIPQVVAAQPAPDAAVPQAEAPAEATAKVEPLIPAVTVPRTARVAVLAAYAIGQILFVLFLKRVAVFFHDVFLAENTGGFLTLLLAHAAMLALLPRAAMIACFFWVILLGLQFLIMIWFLRLVAGTRKAIG
jgi:hypothetical protein